MCPKNPPRAERTAAKGALFSQDQCQPLCDAPPLPSPPTGLRRMMTRDGRNFRSTPQKGLRQG